MNKHGNRFKDLTGIKFTRLIVIKLAYIGKHNHSYWLCKCECGKEKVINSSCLLTKNTRSCGCLTKELIKKLFTIHGMSNTRFHIIWCQMKQRCFYKNAINYYLYGGRGITVCKRWLKFLNFRDDMYESYLKHVEKYGKKQTTIDRINNNGNYHIGNTKWSTIKTQQNNKRNNHLLTYKGTTLTVSQWANKLNISPFTLFSRLNQSKWSIEKTLTSKKRINQFI